MDEPRWFSVVKDGAIWVARQATQFFDNTGTVIAAVATDAFESAGSWTQNAIDTTCREIYNGVYGPVSDALDDFADTMRF